MLFPVEVSLCSLCRSLLPFVGTFRLHASARKNGVCPRFFSQYTSKPVHLTLQPQTVHTLSDVIAFSLLPFNLGICQRHPYHKSFQPYKTSADTPHFRIPQQYQLLRKTPCYRSRCQSPQALSSQSARRGEPIKIPGMGVPTVEQNVSNARRSSRVALTV